METKYIIYCLERNNEPFYVGVTKDISNRIYSHSLKFPFNFTHSILFVYDNKDDAYNKEGVVISSYISMGFNLINSHKRTKYTSPKQPNRTKKATKKKFVLSQTSIDNARRYLQKC